MKGGISGVKVSQFSLILIGLVCVTVLVLTWTKTSTLTSLFPAQGAVPVEFLEANRSPILAETKEVESEASSGVEPAVEGGNSEKLTTVKDKDESLPVEILEANRSPVQIETREVESVASSGVDDAVEGGNTENLTTIKNKEIHPTVEGKTESEEVPGEKNTPKQSDTHLVAPQNSSTTLSSSVREQTSNLPAAPEKKDCNYAKGKWVMDDTRPLYSGFNCKQWLSPMWACRLTQRKYFEYEKLRWQPKECKMEEFTASKFLRRMQDKTLAFVGDSLGRQQFQSLMCMATSGKDRLDVLDVGHEFGLVIHHGAARPDGWAYRFPSTNTTILYYWSASLCDLEPIDASNPTTDIAMHLDRPPAFLRRYLHKIDVLVLNTGHHWNRGKLNANRWKMYVGGAPNTNRNIATIAGAKNFTIYSIVRWVDSQLPLYPGLKAFLRSISPRHFFNGDWNTGGTCDNTTPLSGGKEILKDDSSDPLAAGAVIGTRVKLLDITGLSELRDEGHISRYSIKATAGVQDCLHWCLPGVPDTWNEVLFAQI